MNRYVLLGRLIEETPENLHSWLREADDQTLLASGEFFDILDEDEYERLKKQRQDGGDEPEDERLVESEAERPALTPAEIREKKGIESREDRMNAALADADAQHPEYDRSSAVDRLNGGYPASPELVANAVEELEAAGRHDAAQRMIWNHPGQYAASDHESIISDDQARALSSNGIRANAEGEADASDDGWSEGDPYEDLAPSHPWMDINEYGPDGDDT